MGTQAFPPALIVMHKIFRAVEAQALAGATNECSLQDNNLAPP
jgi:hypothetical protein